MTTTRHQWEGIAAREGCGGALVLDCVVVGKHGLCLFLGGNALWNIAEKLTLSHGPIHRQQWVFGVALKVVFVTTERQLEKGSQLGLYGLSNFVNHGGINADQRAVGKRVAKALVRLCIHLIHRIQLVVTKPKAGVVENSPGFVRPDVLNVVSQEAIDVPTKPVESARRALKKMLGRQVHIAGNKPIQAILANKVATSAAYQGIERGQTILPLDFGRTNVLYWQVLEEHHFAALRVDLINQHRNPCVEFGVTHG
jgi:hypothetical protein